MEGFKELLLRLRCLEEMRLSCTGRRVKFLGVWVLVEMNRRLLDRGQPVLKWWEWL